MKPNTIVCMATAVIVAMLFGARPMPDPPMRGDLNLDGTLDLSDVRPFATALRNTSDWQDEYGHSRRDLLERADYDGDGLLSSDDISGFCDALRRVLAQRNADDVGEPAGGGTGLVDLDVDSDNDSATNPPHRSSAEEAAENAAPGKFVLVNNDDDDFDGISDKDENGEIATEQDDLIPLVLEITPAPGQPLLEHYEYDFFHGPSVRLWRSRIRGDFSNDVVLPDHIPHYTHRVTWLGDLNCDASFDFFDIDPFLLALLDPSAYESAFPNCDLLYGDMNYDARLDFFDIDPFVYAILHPEAHVYVPVLVWAESLTASAAAGDVAVACFADTDRDAILESSDSVRSTCVSLTPSTNIGTLGSAIVWSIAPSVSPVSFDASTTGVWGGAYYPLVGIPSSLFSATYSASQVHETGPTQAATVVGDGTVANAPNAGDLDGGGQLRGVIQFQFGTIAIRRSLTFTPESNVARWHAIDYPDGPGGLEAPVLGMEWESIPLMQLSYLASPQDITEAMLTHAAGFHIALVVMVTESAIISGEAPQSIDARIVTFDSNGAQLAELPLLTLGKLESDNDPNHIHYVSDLTRPVVLTDVALDPQMFPNVHVLRASSAGTVVLLPIAAP